MWVKDCEEGSMVLETFKNMHWKGCEALCKYNNQQCKTYLYDEDSLNCALTSATGGTSLANGISGPDLPHKKPSVNRGRSKPAEGTEDCSEYHFRDCSNEQVTLEDLEKASVEKAGTTWQKRKGNRNVWECLKYCKEGGLDGAAESFAFLPIDTEDCKKKDENQKQCLGKCGGYERSQVRDFIRTNCNTVSGRVGDALKDEDETMFDSCKLLDTHVLTSKNPCRRGYCELQHYGDPIDEDPLPDESKCKNSCFGYQTISGKRCTHYEYNQKEKKCVYYQVNTTKSVQYSCWMHAGGKHLEENVTSTTPNPYLIMDLTTCIQDVITKPGGSSVTPPPGGQTTTETPVTNRDHYTSLTTPTTTTIDCGNARMDIAFLYDDSGSMGDEDQAKVKEWMKKLIDIYQIDGRNQRAAVMEWASGVGETIGFEEELDGEALKQRIDGISHSGGGTHGANALREAFSRFFNSAGDPEVYQRVFFLSDGESGDDLAEAARPFHGDLKNGIRMTPIYIGSGEIPQQMIDMLGHDGQTKGYTNSHYHTDIDTLSSDQFIEKISGCPLGRALGRSKTG